MAAHLETLYICVVQVTDKYMSANFFLKSQLEKEDLFLTHINNEKYKFAIAQSFIAIHPQISQEGIYLRFQNVRRYR